jgi:hypothetical protein
LFWFFVALFGEVPTKQKRNGRIKRSKQESGGGGGTSPSSADGQKRRKTNTEQFYPLVAFTTVFLGL